MKPGDLLAGRYEIVRELGRSPVGSTALARDASSGAAVIAKTLSLALVKDWKAVELFEREADVLKSLHHERIPACVDSFRADVDGDPRFVLVRAYVEGSDLQQMVEGGWRGTEEDIRGIGRQLLAIVSYIHGLRPPVIHRDINPRNVVMRADGAVFLVDFGGVQDAIRLSAQAASTMIGTPGYAPMEQFVGRATVRSDLYGLAATLVFLLTRRSPADLPTHGLKIDIGSIMDISSPGLKRVLASWLEPDETARTIGLDQADALLTGGAAAEAVTRPAALERPPFGSRIVYSEKDGVYRYIVPGGQGGSRWGRGPGPDDAGPDGMGPDMPGMPGMPGMPFDDRWGMRRSRGRHDFGRRDFGRRRASGTFGIVWLGFVGFWIYSAFRMEAPPVFLFFAIPFLAVGVGMLRRTLSTVFGKLHLEIGPSGLSYTRRLIFSSRTHAVPLQDVGECRLEGALSLDVGAKTLRFGEGLSRRELEWLRDSMNAALRDARAQTGRS